MWADAVWEGTNRDACLGISGACWPFVRAKIGQFVYGFYPHAERWRPDLVFVVGATACSVSRVVGDDPAGTSFGGVRSTVADFRRA